MIKVPNLHQRLPDEHRHTPAHHAILMQFLVEALGLSLFGGVIGLVWLGIEMPARGFEWRVMAGDADGE